MLMPNPETSVLFLREPGEPARYYRAERAEGYLQNAFIFHSFDNKTEYIYNIYQISAFPEIRISQNAADSFAAEKGYREYTELLKGTIARIRCGEVEKVVHSRSHRENLRVDVVRTFHSLCSAFPEACVYLLNTPETGCWIGASPELLLNWKHGELQTVALAGTRSLDQSWTDKEIEEQSYIGKHFRQVAAQQGITDIRESETESIVYGNLQHLISRFAAKASYPMAEAFLKQWHPTPAVGGYPQEKALDIIAETEGYDRSFYSGYFGKIAGGEHMNLYVNLRCARIYSDAAVWFAGGGITAMSDPEAEWQETEKKIATVRSCFAELA